MNRRHYLRSLAVPAAAGSAGCLGGLGIGGAPGTVLGPPELDLSEASHPSYGDELPAITLPDPIAGEPVSTEALEGERTTLLTFFYTNCPDPPSPPSTGGRRRGGLRRPSRVPPDHLRPRARHRAGAPRVRGPAGGRPRGRQLALSPPRDVRAGETAHRIGVRTRGPEGGGTRLQQSRVPVPPPSARTRTARRCR
jgi:hypothetical protein